MNARSLRIKGIGESTQGSHTNNDASRLSPWSFVVRKVTTVLQAKSVAPNVTGAARGFSYRSMAIQSVHRP